MSKRKIKKFVKRFELFFAILLFMGAIGVGAFMYFYPNEFNKVMTSINVEYKSPFTKNEPLDETPIYSGDTQNEDGYYYVTTTTSDSYYKDAIDLIGDALKLRLRTIINTNIERQTYDDARQMLAEADKVTKDGVDYTYTIYDSKLVNHLWDSKTWHREHVWPNSRLGMARVTGSGRNQGSDLHNLRAINPGVNSSRSNRFYALASGENQTVGTDGYYPGDDHRGDVARILFYMITMYDFLSLQSEDIPNEAYELSGAVMGRLDLLLEWHRLDPVDDFERQRNDVIYSYQKNRNPYIDKPAYVHLVFEGFQIDTLTPKEETAYILPVYTMFGYQAPLN